MKTPVGKEPLSCYQNIQKIITNSTKQLIPQKLFSTYNKIKQNSARDPASQKLSILNMNIDKAKTPPHLQDSSQNQEVSSPGQGAPQPV